MRLTIVPADSCIIKDGVSLVFPFIAPAEWHAVQWYGARGVIEKTQGEPEAITNAAIVQPYADAFDAEAARLAALNPPLNAAEIRRREIIARLSAIDAATVRPSREIAAALADGKPAQAFAKNKLATLETEAAALRAELATL